jgi:hypothetical protein
MLFLETVTVNIGYALVVRRAEFFWSILCVSHPTQIITAEQGGVVVTCLIDGSGCCSLVWGEPETGDERWSRHDGNSSYSIQHGADVTAKNYRETAQVIDDGNSRYTIQHGADVTAKNYIENCSGNLS